MWGPTSPQVLRLSSRLLTFSSSFLCTVVQTNHIASKNLEALELLENRRPEIQLHWKEEPCSGTKTGGNQLN